MCYYDDLILKTVVCSDTWHKKTCALKCKYCVGQISFISYMIFPIRNCSRWLLTTLLTSRLTERCLREWGKCFGVHITAQPSTPIVWPRKFKFTVILRNNFRHLTGGHAFPHTCMLRHKNPYTSQCENTQIRQPSYCTVMHFMSDVYIPRIENYFTTNYLTQWNGSPWYQDNLGTGRWVSAEL